MELSVEQEGTSSLLFARIECYDDRTSEVPSWIMRHYFKIESNETKDPELVFLSKCLLFITML